MSIKKIFSDGSCVEWIDRETLKYSKESFSVLVWVDFEPGFFSGGRIIRTSSIKEWDTKPEGTTGLIHKVTKQNIINRIQEYYKSINKRCRVEMD
jgi:hypothetical protein